MELVSLTKTSGPGRCLLCPVGSWGLVGWMGQQEGLAYPKYEPLMQHSSPSWQTSSHRERFAIWGSCLVETAFKSPYHSVYWVLVVLSGVTRKSTTLLHIGARNVSILLLPLPSLLPPPSLPPSFFLETGFFCTVLAVLELTLQTRLA